MTFSNWLTSVVHVPVTNYVSLQLCVLEEDSAQLTSWDVMVSGEMINLVPRGNNRSEMTPKSGWKEYNQPWEGLDIWMERWLQTPPEMVHRSALWTLLTWWVYVRTFLCARGTWCLWCQGHETFDVQGAQTDHRTMSVVLGPDRSDNSFIFATTPLSIGVGALQY